MTVGKGAWIAPTLAIDARLRAIPEGPLREEAERREAERSGISLLTMRRNLTSARYVRTRAKSVGLDIDDVTAASLTIETLTCLEARDPQAGRRLRAPVLRGDVTARRMAEILRGTPEIPTPTRLPGEWPAVARAAIALFHDGEPEGSWRGGTSEVGKILHVDIEVRPGGAGGVHAVFLSPRDGFSECAGMAPDHQARHVLAAVTMYDGVGVAVHDAGEAAALRAVLDGMRRGPWARPRVGILDAAPTGAPP